MIGIVVVSHSRPLAQAAVALAYQLVPEASGPKVVIAAGLTDEKLGTDAAAISLAIASADAGDGVLVLLDFGGALLSVELAVKFLDPDIASRVTVSSAPLIEGLLAAVASASTGAPLDQVAASAQSGLDPKRERLGDGPPLAPGIDSQPQLLHPTSARPRRKAPLIWRATVRNEHGLHIRPSAALVTALREMDADVRLTNATTGKGPAPADSLSLIAALELQQGQTLEARITGPEAEHAREILADLASRDFGERQLPAPRAAKPDPISPATLPKPADCGPSIEADPASPTASGRQAVVGPVYRRTSIPNTDGYHPRAPKDELERFTDAVAEVRDYLEALEVQRGGASDILQAQATLLADRELNHDIVGRITEGFGAVDAVIKKLSRAAHAFDALTDPYLRERAEDFRSLRRLLLLALMQRPLTDSDPEEPCVWLLDDLNATTAARLDARTCLGVITTSGGDSGHGVLTAKARGIPVLAGRPEAADLKEGQLVAFDPVDGELWPDPSHARQARLASMNRQREAASAAAAARAHEPVFARDGGRVLVEANVSSLADAVSGAYFGAEGSGIVRTEILFAAHRIPPGVEAQAEVFTAIGAALRGGRITIRTWDVGGDKPLAFLPQPHETNPALGERGLRTMRRVPEMFAQQLRAVCLTARETAVRVMFPMVSDPDEIRWARRILDAVRLEVPCPDFPVGMMIEVPSAALRASDFEGLIDFASIGTNDLAQYAYALDRTNATVSHLARSDAPAIFDLIGMVCRGLRGIPVAVCGDLASDPSCTDHLVRLGVRELSVRPPIVPHVKQAVRWS